MKSKIKFSNREQLFLVIHFLSHNKYYFNDRLFTVLFENEIVKIKKRLLNRLLTFQPGCCISFNTLEINVLQKFIALFHDQLMEKPEIAHLLLPLTQKSYAC